MLSLQMNQTLLYVLILILNFVEDGHKVIFDRDVPFELRINDQGIP